MMHPEDRDSSVTAIVDRRTRAFQVEFRIVAPERRGALVLGAGIITYDGDGKPCA